MKKKSNIIDINHQLADLKVERILAMSDDEIMVEAIREYGSPENARKAVIRTCQGINNALSRYGIKPIRFAVMEEGGDIEGWES